MQRRSLDEQDTLADHWKNRTVQEVKRVPGIRGLRRTESGSAGNRRLWRVIWGWVAVALFFGFVGVVARLAWSDAVIAEVESPVSVPPKFETDGTLDEAWLRAKVDFSTPPPLFRIKEILKEEPQVREAVVTRKPDGALLVQVSERTPAARIMVRLPDGGTEPRLVSTDGVIFRGVNAGRMLFANLPLIEGARPKPGAIADTLEGFEPVARFLTLARERHIGLYREWQRISLRDYPGRPDAPGALFRVRPRLNTQSPDAAAVVEIIFSAQEDRFSVELGDLDRSIGRWVLTKLSEADRARYPAYVLDMSIWNMSNPRRPYPEPRLIPAGDAPRRP